MSVPLGVFISLRSCLQGTCLTVARFAPLRKMDLPTFLLPRGIEHGTRQASVFGIGISFAVFVLVVICLRLYVRISLINAIGVDDGRFSCYLCHGSRLTFP